MRQSRVMVKGCETNGVMATLIEAAANVMTNATDNKS